MLDNANEYYQNGYNDGYDDAWQRLYRPSSVNSEYMSGYQNGHDDGEAEYAEYIARKSSTS